jgi:excisionase family DNA binding protein
LRGAFAAETKTDSESLHDAREVMNIRQAAKYLGVSPDTLYKYLSRGSIPAFKLGNRWRFKKSMLDRWMERQSQSGTGSNKRGSSA